jgi:hypothetical protein
MFMIFGKKKRPSQPLPIDPAASVSAEVWSGGFHSLGHFVTCESIAPPLPDEAARRLNSPGLGKISPYEASDYPREYYINNSPYYDILNDCDVYPVPDDLPDFFHMGCIVCIKRHLADVFLKHSLGKSRMYPVIIYYRDKITKFPGEYFGIYFGEAKAAVSFDDCVNVEIFQSKVGPLFERRTIIPYGTFSVRRSALDDLDLWIDSQCYDSFFMSGRLKQALEEAGMTQDHNFSPCRVV